MYRVDDTIIAVSSPASQGRVLVRMSGPGTLEVLEEIFEPSIPSSGSAVLSGDILVGPQLRMDARVYVFRRPHSYTGEDIAEIHINTNSCVTEKLLCTLLGAAAAPVRMAGPGEFTARAYFNGKIDLAQAEAVGEIVAGSNRFQLAAAQKLLAGRLGETTAAAQAEILDCLSLIEAGLDFSQEDIQVTASSDLTQKLGATKKRLEQLLSGSITYESLAALPAVGIAGAPNAGKSSLLNRLLGRDRSIVSELRKTTRDVLTGVLTLKHCKCVLFDCAGLVPQPTDMLDELTQHAAMEALRNSSVVLFCVDVSKTDYSEDMAIRRLVQTGILIPVATKSDLLEESEVSECVGRLEDLFGTEFVATSAKTGTGVDWLRKAVDGRILMSVPGPSENAQDGVALTARHRQAVSEAVDNIGESISELESGNDELAAMTLRAAHRALSAIERQNIDEQVLDRIFSRFCVGK
ncbi:MAG TPA: GTPase [Sedimentisphaerales bacterium]|nr:GTPase [Sedimentisphaerales bacterium]